MYYIDKSNAKQHSFPTYGRQFDSYKWYKPVFVGILFAAFYLLLFMLGLFGVAIIRGVAVGDAAGTDTIDTILNIMSGGYDTMDMSDPLQAAIDLGGLAIAIPALWLASVIVRDRPFSSYQSSRGGWSRKVFWRCMPIAFIVNGLPIIINDVIIEKGYENFTIKFTIVSFIVLTVLGPLQCIAEEYMFRSFVMQTLGSWVRIPLIAVIIQSVIFAAGHPYNRIGQIAILASGTAFALSAWFGRGIEVSAALHIVNNMTIFYLQGFGMTTVSSEATVPGMLMDVAISAVYVLIIFWLSRKTKWFDKVRKDDVARVNAKIAEKKAKKAARKAAKAAKKAGGAVFEVTGAAGSAAADAVSQRIENVTAAPAQMPSEGAGAAEEVPVSGYTGAEERRSSEGGKHFKK